MKDKKEAVIILEDGKSFHGTALGSVGETISELCFNTGMSGYQGNDHLMKQIFMTYIRWINLKNN